jgi:hypothetical protein
MSEGLIRAHAEVEKLMPFLHLPVQSGSDRILKAMNRSHSATAICASSSGCARRGPTSPVGRLHRRLPRRDRRGFRGHAEIVERR